MRLPVSLQRNAFSFSKSYQAACRSRYFALTRVGTIPKRFMNGSWEVDLKEHGDRLLTCLVKGDKHCE